jgi:hypothetical protein
MEQREDSADWKTLVEFLSSLIQGNRLLNGLLFCFLSDVGLTGT